MKKVEIFDPAMCCPTGICGPSIDPELLRISTVINSLKEKGIVVKRFGLSSEPQEFISNTVINELLQKEGADVLPVTLVDGKVVKVKAYPTNEELSAWLETDLSSNQIPIQNNCGCDCGPNGCC